MTDLHRRAVPVDPDLLARGRVRVTRDGPVVTITLSRPEARNAQTPVTWQALASIGAALDDSVRVVVVAGDGPSFSAGLDRAVLDRPGPARDDGAAGRPELSLPALASRAPRDVAATLAGFQQGFTWLGDPRVVSVAAVQGHAVGAGFQLALACDLRVVAHDARFAMRETTLGLVPDLGGTGPLVRAVGYARAVEICLTGRWVGAEEAVRIGLATLSVAPPDLGAAVADLVSALLAPDAGAVRDTMQVLHGATERTLSEQLAMERAASGRRLAARTAQRPDREAGRPG